MGGPGRMGGPRLRPRDAWLQRGGRLPRAEESELLTKLQSGKSLADIAKDQGKSVDGLINAMVADAKKRLDQAVKDGHLTPIPGQPDPNHIKQHLTDLVNGTAPQGFGPSFRGGPGFPGPGRPPSFQQSGGMGTGWGSSA